MAVSPADTDSLPHVLAPAVGRRTPFLTPSLGRLLRCQNKSKTINWTPSVSAWKNQCIPAFRHPPTQSWLNAMSRLCGNGLHKMIISLNPTVSGRKLIETPQWRHCLPTAPTNYDWWRWKFDVFAIETPPSDDNRQVSLTLERQLLSDTVLVKISRDLRV